MLSQGAAFGTLPRAAEQPIFLMTTNLCMLFYDFLLTGTRDSLSRQLKWGQGLPNYNMLCCVQMDEVL